MANNKKKKQVKTNWQEKFYNFWKIHWFWYTIILGFPTLWFSIVLQYLGQRLRFLDDNSEFTRLGFWITFAIIAMVIIISFIEVRIIFKIHWKTPLSLFVNIIACCCKYINSLIVKENNTRFSTMHELQ